MRRILCFAVLCAALLTSCSFMKETKYTPSEAEEKLRLFMQKEGSVGVTTRLVGRTMWVYLPMTEQIFDVRAAREQEPRERKKTPQAILSFDQKFEKRIFIFDYDVVPDVLPGESASYGSAYNENYTKKRQLVYQGLQETFFNMTETPTGPEFFVVVIADTTKGIATKSTFLLKDLKRFMSEAIPFDEYYMREMNEIFGDQNLIGDKQGRYLKYKEVLWGQFLSEQIKVRAKFKFTQSDFPPKADPDQEIISIAANTFRIYAFTDFDSVQMNNLRQKRQMLFSKEQLKTYEAEADWEKEQGRLTVIHFNMPNPPNEKPEPEPVPEKEAAK